MEPYHYMDFKNMSDAAHPLLCWVDNRSAFPGGVDVNKVLTAAQGAWSAWNAVSCAIPKSQVQGFTGTQVPSPSNPYDIYNVTPVFVTDQNDPYYSNVFSWDLSAVTLPIQYAGVLQTCDVYLNGTDRLWSTDPPVPADHLDVQTVLLHETGHCLGLDHQPFYPESIMQGDILPGEEQHDLSPTDDDILCQRYPTTDGIGSPCTGAGTCGSAIPGIACVTQNLPGQPNAQFCTVGCDIGSGVPCDTPLVCQSSTAFAGHNGACLRPGTTTTLVGAACQSATQVQDCGSSIAICQDPVPDPGGGGVWWQDGYCTQGCDTGQPQCPSGSTCIQLNYNGTSTPVCMQTCTVGSAQCRPGYACALASGTTSADGVCIPRCFTDADCGLGFTCRSCDGLCVLTNSSTQVGDPCGLDTDCGAGQVCLPLTTYSNQGQCTLPCGTGCGACPGGSTCQPVPGANNQYFCLRGCNGPGTCNSGLQCGNLPTGKACLPPCMADLDCPVGLICSGGTCVPPIIDNDAGCALCPHGDAGVPIHPHPMDAGLGDGGAGGCGCNTGGAPWALLALALGRRTWRRPRQP
jgi:hypothetical protein